MSFPVFIDSESTDNIDIEMLDLSLDTSQDEEMEIEDILSSSEDEINQALWKFTQQELSDLCRNLGLSKEGSEPLSSRLRDKNSLVSGTKVTYYRTRDKPFRKYFIKSNKLTYCNDVNGLFEKFKIQYKSSQWRLFIDSSTRSLKAILLHNGNKYAPIPCCIEWGIL